MSEKKPGVLFKFPDGRQGIAYNSEQGVSFGGKLLLKMVDDKYQPVISKITGRQAVKMELASNLKLIGFID